MRYARLAVAALFAFAATLARADDDEQQDDHEMDVGKHGDGHHDRKLGLVGKSGGIKLASATGDGFIQLSWRKIIEVNAQGSPIQTHSLMNLANENFSLSNPIATMIAGVNATLVTLSSTLNVAGAHPTLAVNIYTFPTTVTVNNAGQPITVDADGVKFDILMSNWPFANATNQLKVGMRLASKGGHRSSEEAEIEHKNMHERRVAFGLGQLDLPTKATVDGSPADISYTLEQESGRANIVLTFPHFTTLVYDPVMSINSGFLAQVSMATILALIGAAMML